MFMNPALPKKKELNNPGSGRILYKKGRVG